MEYKFTGSQVNLSSHKGGIRITMKDKDTYVLLDLSSNEGGQLLSFLLSAYGLADSFIEEYDDEPDEGTVIN